MRIFPLLLVCVSVIGSAVAEEPAEGALVQRVSELEKKVAQLEREVSDVESDSDGDKREVFVIEVAKDGSFSSEGKGLSNKELTANLKKLVEANPEQSVVIRAGKETLYRDVIGVVDLCHKVGVRNVSFATQK